MGLAEAAAAPTGYLDFCQRQPEDCGGAPPAVVRKVAEVELARRNAAEAKYILAGTRPTTTAALQSRNVNWSNTFAEARRRREMAEQSNAAIDAAMAAALTPPAAAPSGLIKVNSGGDGASLQAQRLVHTPTAQVQGPPALTGEVERPAMTPALWSQITRINDKVNRDITRRSDLQTYGALDHWATPLLNGDRYGDCEDYVLEKRRALIAAGLPASALSIAVANTSWGESHAVLLVATDQGDYVLDSLTPWILPWRKANLTWRERQVAGAPFRWAMVNTALTTDVVPASPRTVTGEPSIRVAVESPPGFLRTEGFNGRPNGAHLTDAVATETESLVTLAQASGGGPLRGRLH